MSRCRSLVLPVLAVCFAISGWADDAALWQEYGLFKSSSAQIAGTKVLTYELKDPTGALAAWEWQRPADGKPCQLAPFCSTNGHQTVISDFNILLVWDGKLPTQAAVQQAFAAFPNKRDSSLPAILSFIPKDGLKPNSARYVLGNASLGEFAPELSPAKAGFEQGGEAQVATYRTAKTGEESKLVIFYYPTPEMARDHAANFKGISGTHVKRSGVLVVVVPPPASQAQADGLMSRIEYQAKVTWNDVPPPSPIKPLYALLWNIIYLSLILIGICTTAGLIYAGMRIYRRRYGTLESDEAMTTLRLTGR